MDNNQIMSSVRFMQLADTLLATTDASFAAPGAKAKFGDNSLRIHNKIFAMLYQERLVVKLPKSRVDALIASGEGERLDPGHGRRMKEWLSLSPASSLDWLVLATEALEFVRQQ